MDMGSAPVSETGGSSSSSSPPTDSLNGLKFGQKIYFENMCTGDAKSGGGSSSSAAATHKKGRGGVFQSGHQPRCQVEGCNVDLGDAKAYYSRHKVCGMHSKFPMVIVAGLEQRFCQQCSRFHQLQEFDQGKRSCRRRLAGHNERRRKPPPGSLFSTRHGHGHLSPSIIDNGSRVGSILMDFSSYPGLTRREPWLSSRSGRVNENHANTTTGKLLLHSWQNDTGTTSSQLLQSSTGGTHFLGPGIPSGGCITGVTDSTCALSLLSNQPWGSSSNHHASGFGVHPSVNNQVMPMAQVTLHGSSVDHFSSPSWSIKGNEVISGVNGMTSDLGLCQISGPFNTSYSGDLELAQQGRRQYTELMQPRPFDLATQEAHWSL